MGRLRVRVPSSTEHEHEDTHQGSTIRLHALSSAVMRTGVVLVGELLEDLAGFERFGQVGLFGATGGLDLEV